MRKWLKNSYYMLQNKYYTYLIHKAQQDRVTGDITRSYYDAITLQYKNKIMVNLGKIVL